MTFDTELCHVLRSRSTGVGPVSILIPLHMTKPPQPVPYNDPLFVHSFCPVCQGALGQVETAQEIFKEVPELAKKKSNSQQMEAFLIRKVRL